MSLLSEAVFGGSPQIQGEPPIEWFTREVLKMIDEKLVPLVKIGNREFFVDIYNREFVDANDLNQFINMHSELGRNMVNEMIGMEWHCFGVYPIQQNEV